MRAICVYIYSVWSSGYLVIILGVTSLEKLLVELKKWEDRELS